MVIIIYLISKVKTANSNKVKNKTNYFYLIDSDARKKINFKVNNSSVIECTECSAIEYVLQGMRNKTSPTTHQKYAFNNCCHGGTTHVSVPTRY